VAVLTDDVVPLLYVKTVSGTTMPMGKNAGEEVKAAFVAVKLVKITGAGVVGVPDIIPVFESSERPADKGVAVKDTGDLDAVIVYGVIGLPIS